MNNLNSYSQRMGSMSSSSMFYQSSSYQPTAKSGNTLTVPSSFNPFANRSQPKQQKQEDNKTFPKAMLSHSMIDMNSTSTTRRAAFGKLDSMARKVVPTFQDQTLHSKNSIQTGSNYQDNPAQSMMVGQNTGYKKYSSNLQSFENVGVSVEGEGGLKKRRQSIDLGSAVKRTNSSQTLPFMRRMKAPEDRKVQPTTTQTNNSLDDQKSKNFQFLRKRREVIQQQGEPLLQTPSLNQAQSMKTLNSYSGGGLKRPQFLNIYGKLNSPSNNVQCPQQKPTEINKPETVQTSLTPNFEFKKKKFYDSAVEQPLNSRTLFGKDNITPKRELLTLKDKLAMKTQRQIKLQDFQLMQKLGKGAFGDVYIAQQKTIGFVCVIKKVSKKRIREAKVEEHILREIKIQSYLNHKNITSLFGYFHDEDNLYLIMEALPDGSLQNVKKKKKLPEKETASIVRQVAEGLRYMHQEYLIHRDMKPQNLFVNGGTIKIGDFGCSIYNRDLGLRNTMVGCLEYSSPEQLSKEGYSDKIDAWSLGILTYELLFGKSPFSNQIIKITQNKQVKPELLGVSFPPGIPIKVETRQFIENLLEGDPDRRMDMDEVLNHAFLREQMSRKEPKEQDF